MLKFTPCKNLVFTDENKINYDAFSYDATLNGENVGKITAYLKDYTVIVNEITASTFNDSKIADGLIRSALCYAADRNILYYAFSKDTIKFEANLVNLGFKINGDYIYKFFEENKHCSSNCSNCTKSWQNTDENVK